MTLTAIINHEEISRERVLTWELGRAHKVLRLLGAELIPGENVEQARKRLLAVKRQLGPAELERRLATRLALSDQVSSLSAKAAKGKRSVSTARIISITGSAQAFADWFEAECATDNSDAMLAACPDHYVLGDSDRGQMVIETTGGAPLPSRFYIDYTDLSSLTTVADPAFPIQIAGVARNKQGVLIGGVRHQMRDLDGGGFEVWMSIEFPAHSPQVMLNGHAWHLACEFSNWIKFSQN